MIQKPAHFSLLNLATGIILGLTSLVIIASALNQNLTVRTIPLDLAKIDRSATDPIRIALLTDLHSNRYGETQSDLVERIKTAQPNLILLVGDIIDDKTKNPRQPVRELLQQIVPLAPSYYVTGNHEKRFPEIVQVANLKFLQEMGVEILDQRATSLTVNGQEIILAGASDPEIALHFDLSDQVYGQQLMTDLQPTLATQSALPQILLAHRPEDIDLYAQLPLDLVVSGHAHGGHWRIPGLIDGFYAPNQGILPSRTNGLYQDKTNSTGGLLNQVVSRGLDQSWRIPRLFNPPEVILIDLY